MSIPGVDGVRLVATGEAISVFAFNSVPELEIRGPSAFTSPGSSGGAAPVSLRNCSYSICEGSGKSGGGALSDPMTEVATGAVTGEYRPGVGGPPADRRERSIELGSPVPAGGSIGTVTEGAGF